MELEKIKYRDKDINFKLGVKGTEIKYTILGSVTINKVKKLALKNENEKNSSQILVSLPLDKEKYIRVYD